MCTGWWWLRGPKDSPQKEGRGTPGAPTPFPQLQLPSQVRPSIWSPNASVLTNRLRKKIQAG